MGLKAFVLGGLLGFSVGVYHGYNYAVEHNVTEKVIYESKHEAPLEKILNTEYRIAKQDDIRNI